MLDYVRFGLYAVVAFLVFSLVQIWQVEHPAPAQTQSVIPLSTSAAIPSVTAPNQQGLAQNQANTPPSPLAMPKMAKTTSKIVSIQNEYLKLFIDTRGGNIVRAELLKYSQAIGDAKPVVLMNTDNQTRYLANSGLISEQGPDSAQSQAIYEIDEKHSTPQSLQLVWKNAQGNTVNKIIQLSNDYAVDVSYQIHNDSQGIWNVQWFSELARTNEQTQSAGPGFANLATYFGAAISTPEKPFHKISFKEMQDNHLQENGKGGWAAMIQHYFVSAWVPAQSDNVTYFSRITPDHLYAIGLLGQAFSVAPHQTQTVHLKLYAGPAIADQLKAVSPTLSLTIDYGLFWMISTAFFAVMKWIYDWTGNWGVAIILVTVLIKALFYYLSAKSYRSMTLMKQLQPKIESLKKLYGEDKQKLSQATMELYRKEKVNPMSGCLPILIQIPFFIALYWVLVESVELRQAPFILWIHDLSKPDPYYILTVLMVGSMYLQQRLNPTPPDPLQAKVMMAMPLIFGVLFARFPSGLMVYWVVNNTLSFLQQWWIMRSLEKKPLRIANDHTK